jgi:small subunit ribosomal protein S16
MAVVIRMARHGKKNTPFYRIVAADKRYCKEGRHLEILGTFDPKSNALTLKKDRVEFWVNNGAQPSETVERLIQQKA